MPETFCSEFLGVFPAEASVKSDAVVEDFGVFNTNAPGARASREWEYVPFLMPKPPFCPGFKGDVRVVGCRNYRICGRESASDLLRRGQAPVDVWTGPQAPGGSGSFMRRAFAWCAERAMAGMFE